MRWLELCSQLLPAAFFAIGQVHTRSLYGGIPPTAQYELNGGKTLSEGLLFTAYSCKVDNPTLQWVHIINTLQYIPPSVTGYVVPIPSLDVASAEWAAPPGVSQGVQVAGQQAVLTYYSYELPPSGSTLQVSIGTTLPQVVVTGPSDLQGGVTVEGAAQFGGSGDPWFDITHPLYGAKATAADNAAAIQKAIAAAKAIANGAVVFVPPGVFKCQAGLDFSTTTSITFQGCGGKTSGAVATSVIQGTIAMTRLVDGRSTSGFQIRDLMLLCNAAATTFVVDYGLLSVGSGHGHVIDCQIVSFGAGMGLNLAACVETRVQGCFFSPASPAATGAGIGINNTTTCRFIDVDFSTSANYQCVKASTTISSALVFLGITVEGATNTINADQFDFSATGVQGLSIRGLWSGDMNVASTGSIVNLGAAVGAVIDGSWIAGGTTSQIGVTVGANSDGVFITGNDIFSLSVGIAIGANVTNYFEHGHNAATTHRTGTPTSGEIIDAGVTIYGTLTMSGGVIAQQAYQNSAPAFQNLTPDLTVAQYYTMAALTGAINVNAPLNPKKGAELVFQWQQDGTGGRVVTYNAVFKTGGAVAFATTLSTITIDRFVYDGTNWRISSRITGQAI